MGTLLQSLIELAECPQEMLHRLRINDLLRWKRQRKRKPLLLDGARQVGKTVLLEQIFGAAEFRKVHTLDFRKEPDLAELFDDGLDPRRVVGNVELRLNAAIDLQHDLILFDEIGECQPAVDSLKYFAETLPHAFLCASGSNIGLLDSFPVGSVDQLELAPLCFEEFVMAAGEPRLLEALQERRISQLAHRRLWSLLLDYYFVGGMPEAVQGWFGTYRSVHEKVQRVEYTHRNLVAGFERDFGKYAGRLHAQHIGAVFANVPRQLANSQDSSVRRFRFAGVIDRKRRYHELRGPIDWLEAAKLVRKCYPVNGKPHAPLIAQARQNIFRLYLFDAGLLGHMLGLTYSDQRAQRVDYKGFVAENFVQSEMNARGIYPTFGWEQGHAELEFIHRDRAGGIVPVEVKSGSRTRARSLQSYLQRYQPQRALKLYGGQQIKPSDQVEMWPLYHAQFLANL
jgi:hypothetical protein